MKFIKEMWEKKWIRYIGGILGATIAGTVLMVGGVKVVYPAISQLVGLAVAQSATLWNNVKDAAAGDGLSSGILAQTTYVWNGTTFDRVRSASGDALAATGIQGINLLLYNGATFDRVRGTAGSMNVTVAGGVTPADAYANPTTAIQSFSLNGVFNGTTWDRVREPTADALAVTGLVGSAGQVFNGTTWDRVDGISATNNTAATSVGAVQVVPLSTWRVTDTDVGATQSVASKAAGAATIRHVATSISACMSATVAQVPITVNLRDGATGAGTIIRSWTIGVSAVNDSKCVNESGLNESGSANTAMTLEFVAAGAATTTTTVNLSGYSTP